MLEAGADEKDQVQKKDAAIQDKTKLNGNS